MARGITRISWSSQTSCSRGEKFKNKLIPPQESRDPHKPRVLVVKILTNKQIPPQESRDPHKPRVLVVKNLTKKQIPRQESRDPHKPRGLVVKNLKTNKLHHQNLVILTNLVFSW